MSKKRLVFSMLNLVAALAAFVIATYAWFAVAKNVSNSPLTLTSYPGFVTDIQIRFFTLDRVFKIDDETQELKYWDGSTWSDPSYVNPEDTSYTYTGIMLRQYDSYIPIYNTLNNIFVEFRIEYETNDEAISFDIRALADPNIVPQDADFYIGDAGELYISQVSQIQTWVDTSSSYESTSYDTSGGGLSPYHNNMYSTLKTDFENGGYAYNDFYYTVTTPDDTYTTSVDLLSTSENPNTLAANTTGIMYIYFNISYYGDKVQEFQNSTGYTWYFQDIVFEIGKDYS